VASKKNGTNIMTTVAALITGKTGAAISSIAIYGPGAPDVCRKLSGRDLKIEPMSFRLSTVCDKGGIIDEVLIGRESAERYVINCHGNPLIVERIINAAADMGAQKETLEGFALRDLCARYPDDSIAAEAGLAFCERLSYEAVEIICHQTSGGLRAFADRWLEADDIDPEKIHAECSQILKDSDIARLLFAKQKIVLAGLPNSGKSTLFNAFCGSSAAIVTDVRGTTRDWISCQCTIGPITAEIIDTAGLDRSLQDNDIDINSQKKTIALIENADIVLLVIDIGESRQQDNSAIEKMIIESDSKTRLIRVYNKADIYPRELNAAFSDYVVISAASEQCIQRVAREIINACGVDRITPQTTVCFTARQIRLIESICESDCPQTITTKLESIRSGSIEAQ
jgi:tRNA modification GTPase